MLLEMCQEACPAPDRRRHGTSILKNEQHLFTLLAEREIGGNRREKVWKAGLIVCFVTLKLKEMDERDNEKSGV